MFTRMHALGLGLMALSLSACGGNTASELAASTTRDPAILFDATATPANGGINPSMFALDIAGRVMLGANPCMARGKSASLESQRVGDVIEVTALLESPVEPPRRCTREYRPVYAPVRLVVRGNARQVQDVVIKNAGEFGVDLSAFQR